MEKLIDACRTMTTDEILALPDIQERIVLYNEQTEKFKEMVKAHTIVDGNLIISDLRGVDPIYTGNRFMIYSMYPEQNSKRTWWTGMFGSSWIQYPEPHSDHGCWKPYAQVWWRWTQEGWYMSVQG